MRLSGDKVSELAEKKGMNLGQLLEHAGVSRTAYYSLLRKDSILQNSLEAIAEELDVSPLAFLEDETELKRKTLARLKKLEEILSKHKDLDRDDVWHALLLLDDKPIDRLRKGLLRGRQFDFHR